MYKIHSELSMKKRSIFTGLKLSAFIFIHKSLFLILHVIWRIGLQQAKSCENDLERSIADRICHSTFIGALDLSKMAKAQTSQ